MNHQGWTNFRLAWTWLQLPNLGQCHGPRPDFSKIKEHKILAEQSQVSMAVLLVNLLEKLFSLLMCAPCNLFLWFFWYELFVKYCTESANIGCSWYLLTAWPANRITKYLKTRSSLAIPDFNISSEQMNTNCSEKKMPQDKYKAKIWHRRGLHLEWFCCRDMVLYLRGGHVFFINKVV